MSIDLKKKLWSDMTDREHDEALAKLLGFTTIWADDGFGHSLYLHDTGARRVSPNVTENCHLLGARWERVRIDGEVHELFVRFCPVFTSRFEDIRTVEDEIEQRGISKFYIEMLASLLGITQQGLQEHGASSLWMMLRATPGQRAEAAYRVLTAGTAQGVQDEEPIQRNGMTASQERMIVALFNEKATDER